MPQIDDDGNVKGNFLLFNHKYSFNGIWKIKDNLVELDQNLSKEAALKLKG